MTLYYDLPNVLVCVLAIIIACRMKIIPIWIGLIFTVYSFVPFFLNDVLFPADYMKDQFFYFKGFREVRSLNLIPDLYKDDSNLLVMSYILSFLPLPYVETIKSLGFFNRFLFFLLFCWLYKKNFLRGWTLLFLIFYPSLVLYTSLSLRDPLILFLMLVGAIFIIDKKYFKFFLVILPLYILKWQNFYFMIVLFFIFIIFKNKDSFDNLKFKKLSIFISAVFLSTFLIIFFEDILSKIEVYRWAMYNENEGDPIYYRPLLELSDVIAISITSFPNFILKPFIWQAENMFQLIQSIENIFLLIFLIFFTKKGYNQNKFITLKWLLYTVFVLTIYSLVVSNIGTAVRYKFIFIAMYVIGLAYELYKVKGFRFNITLK